MNKNIVILNGSPRGKGNTAALIEAFTKGAEGAGNKVSRFDLEKMNIHACLGCFGGGVNPDHPCVQRDGMDEIYGCYKDADVVVLASPLYYWTMSGQLKCAFDRLFAVAECDSHCLNPKKQSILLMAAEGYGFEEIVYWYDRLEKHIGWKSLGKILAGGVMAVGDIDNRPELEEAEKLGAAIMF